MARLRIVELAMAIATILAGIAVGMAMVNNIIVVPLVGATINMFAGYIVVAGGIIAGLKTFKVIK